MTYLVVPIFVDTAATARRDAALAAEAGADMVELRIDHWGKPLNLFDFPLPCIVTCRREDEGGNSALGEREQLALLRSFVDAAYVDIELQTLQAAPADAKMPIARRIVSSHDFSGRPDRLNNLMLELAAAGGEVSKIAFLARTEKK